MTRASRWRGSGTPPLIPALKPVLLDGYAPYPNLHTRPASCMTVGRNGGRRVTGSDGIERHRSETNLVEKGIERYFFRNECSSISFKFPNRISRAQRSRKVHRGIQIVIVKKDYSRLLIPIPRLIPLFYVKVSFFRDTRSSVTRDMLDPIAGFREKA